MQLVISGAGRGIGLAMLRQLLAEERWTRIYALHRQASQDLFDLAASDRRLQTLEVNLDDDADLQRLDQQLEGSINWVINTTGLLHCEANQIQPEKSLQQLQRASLNQLMQTNAINHLLLIKALQPHLSRKGELKLASLSARVGSIGDNKLGGWYGYRASKAALNQLLHTLSIEMRRFNRQAVCASLHPGTTDTELSKPFQDRVPEGKLFTADYAANQLLQVLDGLEPEHNGGFFAWDGQAIPW